MGFRIRFSKFGKYFEIVSMKYSNLFGYIVQRWARELLSIAIENLVKYESFMMNVHR